MDNLEWQMFDLDVLPEALFGYSHFRSFGGSYINRIRLEEKNIAIGFTHGVNETNFNPPAIIILSDNGFAEILSWLKVYAPATSPLSQFARVLSVSDWDAFQESSISKNLMIRRADGWASLVLGEVLAQGESDLELSLLPLSRAAACFSTAMARTSIVHAHDSAIRTCLDRLIVLEADRRFVRRSVTITDLLPVWTIMNSQLEEGLGVDTVAEIVVEAARKHGNDNKPNSMRMLPKLNDHPNLLSDSIEDRIVAFRLLSSDFMIGFGDAPQSSYSCAMLAAGAFLVGRGTSHSFLLRPLAKRIPAVFAWFGLMAALSGPRSWDVSWSRATKGIERLLRAKFDWTDPHATDVCWTEYSWLAKTFDGVETFSDLPKMLPKVLSIEVVPGAACQLRLQSGQGGNNYEMEQKHSSDLVRRNEELQTALMQFVNLSLKTRLLLENQGGQTPPTQQSLGLGEEKRPYTKNPRTKRSKQSSEF